MNKYGITSPVRVALMLIPLAAGCGMLPGHGNSGEMKCCNNLLVDGSFEYAATTVNAAGGEASPPDGGKLDGLRWIVHTGGAPNTIALFNNAYGGNTAQPPSFYPTPDGQIFAYIGFRNVPGGNSPPYPKCTLSQDIAAPLEAGKQYQVSFLQSAYAGGPNVPQSIKTIKGHVHVEVVPTGGAVAVYAGDFDVPDGATLAMSSSQWRKQTGMFSVPSAGLYTLNFTSDQPDRVCGIDAVSLCDAGEKEIGPGK